MTRPGRLARFTALLAAWAMLLQAATPMLTAWAAQQQGVAVAEICEVHGVAMPGAASPAASDDMPDADRPASSEPGTERESGSGPIRSPWPSPARAFDAMRPPGHLGVAG